MKKIKTIYVKNNKVGSKSAIKQQLLQNQYFYILCCFTVIEKKISGQKKTQNLIFQ